MSERVVSRAQVAAALGKSQGEFDILLPSLRKLGFPDATDSAESHWRIADLLDWVTDQQDVNISFVGHMESWLKS